ncbi:hypothetical protein OROMI_013876 [Orobanche minor]
MQIKRETGPGLFDQEDSRNLNPTEEQLYRALLLVHSPNWTSFLRCRHPFYYGTAPKKHNKGRSYLGAWSNPGYSNENIL